MSEDNQLQQREELKQGEIQKENKMGVMPVGRLLASMSWPAILSMVIQAIYNVVDTFFVSKLGDGALTAITLVFPIQMLMIALGVGTNIGVNSLIARRLGAKKFDEANRAASIGLRLSFINWLVFLVVGIFAARSFVDAFTEDGTIVDMGAIYLSIVCIGSLFIMIQMCSEKILQATGNMIMPMVTNIIGAVTNIILDPLLIFGIGPFPRMGIAGAATATVIGQALAMTVVLYILFHRQKLVHVTLRGKWDGETVKNIYSVGGPMILMQALASILNVFMNGILASFSDIAVAVMGVYGRLQSFIFMPVFGINQGATPIMGYNYGAKNRHRLMRTYKLALIMAFVIMGVGMIIFQVIPEPLLRIFSDSEELIQTGIPAFRAISLCFLPAAFGIISGGLFGATGHGFISLFGALVRQFVGILPLAFLFAYTGGVNMVWWAFPAAEILGTVYFIIAVRYLYNKEIRNLGDGSF